VLVALALVLAAQVELARRESEAALPARVPRSGVTTSPRSRARRMGTALGLTLALCGLATLLAFAVGSLARAAAPDADEELADLAREADDTPRERVRSGRTNGLRGLFPSELRWESGAPVEDDTPIVRVRTAAELDAPLYLRGSVLERFTPVGMAARAGGAALALDALRDDDGWSALAPVPEGESAFEFELEQLPLAMDGRAESVLFVPAPLTALDCPGALLDGARTLWAPLGTQEYLTFRARALERRFERCAGAGDEPVPVLASALELPPPSDELSEFERLARRLWRADDAPRTKVARVLAFFRTEFTYETGITVSPGLAGLGEFLARRAGSCTHYAAAATLLLRLGGVPARVATGFLARPDANEPELYVATPRGAHAWVEVGLAGLGWVTCDPTPAAGGATTAEALASASSRSWWTGSVELFAGFLGGERIAAARLLGTWSELRTRLGPRRWLLLLAPLAVFALFHLRRRLSARPPAAPGPAASPALFSARERLLAALAHAGRPRPPTHTLREHARTLTTDPRTGVPELSDLVERLYRASFGGVRWSAPDEEELRVVLSRLAARNVPPARSP
jgi:transglutaminase-like putative cysteine protease